MDLQFELISTALAVTATSFCKVSEPAFCPVCLFGPFVSFFPLPLVFNNDDDNDMNRNFLIKTLNETPTLA